jgi:signal transduction histidine kinase
MGMTSSFILRHTSLTVGRRLFLGLLPALLAVLLALGLAYYGEYQRQVPHSLALGAAVLAVASLIVTWINTRYLANRIVRLSGAMPPSGAPDDFADADEFDRIEQAVDHLGSALSASEAERARADAAATARLREQATMLAAVVRDAMAQLDDVRLPLHILLETRFGELNENQEELLRDAQKAADAMDGALRRLGQVADANRDAIPVKVELVQVNDVVRAVLPLARAAAERTHARVDTSLEPGLPRVMADRARLAEALALLTDAAAAGTGPERPLVLSTARGAEGISITVAPSAGQTGPTKTGITEGAAMETSAAGASPVSGATVLATRLIAAQGGSAEPTEGGSVVRLPGLSPREPGTPGAPRDHAR